jgi:hypothetical protein
MRRPAKATFDPKGAYAIHIGSDRGNARQNDDGLPHGAIKSHVTLLRRSYWHPGRIRRISEDHVWRRDRSLYDRPVVRDCLVLLCVDPLLVSEIDENTARIRCGLRHDQTCFF